MRGRRPDSAHAIADARLRNQHQRLFETCDPETAGGMNRSEKINAKIEVTERRARTVKE
jgi:hypothetical protein